jgi:uncharacterized protein (TIGR03435 family)
MATPTPTLDQAREWMVELTARASATTARVIEASGKCTTGESTREPSVPVEIAMKRAPLDVIGGRFLLPSTHTSESHYGHCFWRQRNETPCSRDDIGDGRDDCRAQTPAEKLKFEVATIKPSVDNRPPSFQAQPGGRFLVGGPLKLMLALAYSICDYQISGGPSWVATDRWDLQGKAPDCSIPPGLAYPGPATPNHPLLLMLQSLLVDRFQLKMHREMREEPVYELTVAKNGSKMKLSSDQSSPETLAAPTVTDPTPRGRILTRGTKLEGKAIPIAALVSIFADIAKRPIINKTGRTL